MSFVHAFEKLEVWQLSIDLAFQIYKTTETFPENEKFGITNQLRRASTSISANIAEGNSRITIKDKSRFIQIAYGSLMEVLNFLILSQKLAYINDEELIQYRSTINELSNKLNAFNKNLKVIKQ